MLDILRGKAHDIRVTGPAAHGSKQAAHFLVLNLDAYLLQHA